MSAGETSVDPRVKSTDTSDTTDLSAVTNEEFLVGIFGGNVRIERPIVVNFPGNPKATAKKNWLGEPWSAGDTQTDWPGQNLYFSLAVFHANDNGEYHRQKKYFAGVYCVVLDDVGTKVTDFERLSGLKASWKIETSRGNFQVGFVLNEPITEPAVAEALYKAIILAGLCDPGAGGPQSRLARLPRGVNGKYDPAPECKLVEWAPDNRYTAQQIIDELKLDLDLGAVAKQERRGRTAQSDPHEDVVYTPRTTENPVIAAVKEAGLYKSPLGDGKHEITCPWVAEHTDQVDGGTAYWEPDDAFPKGGFHCFHAHCIERSIRDLLEHFGVAAQEARHKPVIRVVPGEISRIVSAAEYELALTKHHYQFGGLIVTVMTDPGTQETLIRALNPQNLVLRISSIVIWERYNKKTGCWEVCDPPPRHSRILYDMNQYPNLPVLLGLARQPYLRPDGSLMTEAGYDPLTKLFGVFNSREFNINERPTRDDAIAALNELKALLAEFAFAAECDLSAALAAILTAAIRPSLPFAPMFHVRAPQIASGKSYLCTLIVAFAGPVIPSAVAFPQDEEECRKLLLAWLLTGPTAIVFDNLTSDLTPYKALCSALTEEFITGRILGVSKTATVSTRAMFLSSGNNVDPVRDMARRCVTVRLDPACEVPATRQFRRDPVGTVRHKRAHFVSLPLIIILAWIAAGCPKAVCKPLASYEQWSDWVRQPLLWLDLRDPATALFETMATDPDRETLGRLMKVWHKFRGNKPTMVRELVKVADKHGKDGDGVELHDLLLDIAGDRGEVDRRRLGWWIKKHANRPVDGLKIERAPGTRNADQWIVVSVASVKSEDSGAPSGDDTNHGTYTDTPGDPVSQLSASEKSLITAYVPTEATKPTPQAADGTSDEVQS